MLKTKHKDIGTGKPIFYEGSNLYKKDNLRMTMQ